MSSSETFKHAHIGTTLIRNAHRATADATMFALVIYWDNRIFYQQTK